MQNAINFIRVHWKLIEKSAHKREAIVRKVVKPRIYGPAKASITMQIFPDSRRGGKEIMMRLGSRAYSGVFRGCGRRCGSGYGALSK